MDNSNESLESLRERTARNLAQLSSDHPHFQLVVAESCTGGLIAASLTALAGASQWFCGSSVTYQEATKVAWLKTPADLIARHSAESAEVTQALARAVLEATPHASFSCATTGHLEPDAERSGSQPHVFVSISRRIGDTITPLAGFEQQLSSETRSARQQEATIFAMQKLLDALQTCIPPSN